MREYEYMEMFSSGSVTKDFIITDGTVSVENGELYYSNETFTITNSELVSDSFLLKENLFSGKDIEYGSCEAAEINFTYHDRSLSIVGKEINVYVYLERNVETLFQLGTYRVFQDTMASETTERHVIAYDLMYDILSVNVANWYKSILPNETASITVKNARENLLNHLGISYVEKTLPNDNVVLHKTIDAEVLLASDMLRALCQITASFGHFVCDLFDFVTLSRVGIESYPAEDRYPNELLFPSEGYQKIVYRSDYKAPANYESYISSKITSVAVRQDNEDVGVTVGTEGNPYNIVGNFLLYGMDATTLTGVAQNFFNAVKDIEYRPYSVETYGNPCISVGDTVGIITSEEIIESYVFSRTLRGIQALKDEYSAGGSELRELANYSLNSQITQMNGKYMKLNKSVEGLEVVIGDENAGLVHEVNMTAQGLSLKVSKSGIVGDLDSAMSGIDVTANQISFNSTGSIVIDTQNFQLKANGDATFSGKVLNTGTWGTAIHQTLIDGGEITATISNLSSNVPFVKVMPTNIYAGLDNAVNFSVDAGGNVSAKQLTVNGSLSATSGSFSSSLTVGTSPVLTSGLLNSSFGIENTGSGLAINAPGYSGYVHVGYQSSALTLGSSSTTIRMGGKAVSWKQLSAVSSSDYVLVGS